MMRYSALALRYGLATVGLMFIYFSLYNDFDSERLIAGSAALFVALRDQ